MKRFAVLLGGGALALTSALVLAQDAPESLLPPGFEKPAARNPAPAQTGNAPSSTSSPVVQAVPGSGGSSGGSAAAKPGLPSGIRIPSLKELEAMTPDQLDDLFKLKPKSDIPPAARRCKYASKLMPDSLRAGARAGAGEAVARTSTRPIVT